MRKAISFAESTSSTDSVYVQSLSSPGSGVSIRIRNTQPLGSRSRTVNFGSLRYREHKSHLPAPSRIRLPSLRIPEQPIQRKEDALPVGLG